MTDPTDRTRADLDEAGQDTLRKDLEAERAAHAETRRDLEAERTAHAVAMAAGLKWRSDVEKERAAHAETKAIIAEEIAARVQLFLESIEQGPDATEHGRDAHPNYARAHKIAETIADLRLRHRGTLDESVRQIARADAAEKRVAELEAEIASARTSLDAAESWVAGFRLHRPRARDARIAELETKWKRDLSALAAKGAECKRMREALELHVSVYGGASHHRDDCESPDGCTECLADRIVNAALTPAPSAPESKPEPALCDYLHCGELGGCPVHSPGDEQPTDEQIRAVRGWLVSRNYMSEISTPGEMAEDADSMAGWLAARERAVAEAARAGERESIARHVAELRPGSTLAFIAETIRARGPGESYEPCGIKCLPPDHHPDCHYARGDRR